MTKALTFDKKEIKEGDILFGCVAQLKRGVYPVFTKVAYVTPKGGFKGKTVYRPDDLDPQNPLKIYGLTQHNNPSNFIHIDPATVHPSVIAAIEEYENRTDF